MARLEFRDVSPAAQKVMRANKGKDSKPEMTVRRMVHAMGYRYRLHRRDLPGCPDLVFGPRRRIVFVHGCFWHGHNCPAGSKGVRTRQAYWTAKIAGNRERDVRVGADLASAGWRLCTVWECECRDADHLAAKLRAFLEEGDEPCCSG